MNDYKLKYWYVSYFGHTKDFFGNAVMGLESFDITEAHKLLEKSEGEACIIISWSEVSKEENDSFTAWVNRVKGTHLEVVK